MDPISFGKFCLIVFILTVICVGINEFRLEYSKNKILKDNDNQKCTIFDLLKYVVGVSVMSGIIVVIITIMLNLIITQV